MKSGPASQWIVISRIPPVTVADGVANAFFNSQLHIENLLVAEAGGPHALLNLKRDARDCFETGGNDDIRNGRQGHTFAWVVDAGRPSVPYAVNAGT